MILEIGETGILKASLMPEDSDTPNVNWSSSNENIAIVSEDGTVTAINSGEAYIYAKSDNGLISDSCKVTVISHVKSIEIVPDSVEFSKIGQSLQLEVNFIPEDAYDKGLKWESDNEKVCLVSSTGNIVAIGDGTAVIIATTNDGGITASCIVKVETQTTGIDAIKADIASGNAEVYNVKGQRMSTLTRGVNIIRKDGDVIKKVIVR